MSYDPFDHDLERGMRNRRRMLGDAWVDKSMTGANSFNADFQNFITRYAWHEVWGRPGLSIQSRRLLVMAVTASLGRWEEYELHLRATLAGPEGTRLTPEEVKEALMQIAIYAGVPAANTGMTIAVKLLRELGTELPPKPAAQAVHTGVGRPGLTRSQPGIFYTLREARRQSAKSPTVVLCPGLGTDLMMWDELANALSEHHQVVCYDLRGHGGSMATPGDYSLSELADDAARLIKELGLHDVVFLGLSLGGMVAQALAVQHSHLLRGVVIANSASTYEPAIRQVVGQRMDTVRDQGVAAVAEAVLSRFFTPEFHFQQAATVDRFRRRLLSTSVPGYVGCGRAVQHLDILPQLGGIRLPTLIIASAQDRSTPLALSEQMRSAIAGAQLRVIEGAGHVSVIEQPLAFRTHVQEFLSQWT